MTSAPPSLWGPARRFGPTEEAELLAEVERLASLDSGVVGESSRVRAFRLHALSLMRFRPPSWSAEPTFFTLEGDPVASCTALWRVRDPNTVTDMLRALGDLAPGESTEIDITVSRDSLLAQCPLLPAGAVVLDSSPVDSLDVSPIATLISRERLSAQRRCPSDASRRRSRSWPTTLVISSNSSKGGDLGRRCADIELRAAAVCLAGEGACVGAATA